MLQRLSFNQMTADPWSLEQAVAQLREERHSVHRVRGGISSTATQRRHLRLIRNAGLRVSSLCRGGWFSAPTAEERRERIADNRLRLNRRRLLGAPVLVIVSGPANGQTLSDARATVLDGLLEVLPDAEKAGVMLGIEPLHPDVCR